MSNLFKESPGKRTLYEGMDNIVPPNDVIPGNTVTSSRINNPHGSLKNALLALDDYLSNWAVYYDDVYKNVTLADDGIFIGTAGGRKSISGVSADLVLYSRKTQPVFLQISQYGTAPTAMPVFMAGCHGATNPVSFGINVPTTYFDSTGKLIIESTTFSEGTVKTFDGLTIIPDSTNPTVKALITRVDDDTVKLEALFGAGKINLAINGISTKFDSSGNLNIANSVFAHGGLSNDAGSWKIGKTDLTDYCKIDTLADGIKITSIIGGSNKKVYLGGTNIWTPDSGAAILNLLQTSGLSLQTIDGSGDGTLFFGLSQNAYPAAKIKFSIPSISPYGIDISGPGDSGNGYIQITPDSSQTDDYLAIERHSAGVSLYGYGGSGQQIQFGGSTGPYHNRTNKNSLFCEGTWTADYGWIIASKHTATTGDISGSLPSDAPTCAMVVQNNGGTRFLWVRSDGVWSKISSELLVGKRNSKEISDTYTTLESDYFIKASIAATNKVVNLKAIGTTVGSMEYIIFLTTTGGGVLDIQSIGSDQLLSAGSYYTKWTATVATQWIHLVSVPNSGAWLVVGYYGGTLS